MNAKKVVFVLSIGFICAVLITHYLIVRPYDEQLMRIQSTERLGNLGDAVLDEPMEIQAILLDYTSDKELVLKAWIALAKYPAATRELLVLYGTEPAFQNALKKYGESIVPVIQYFRANEIWTISAGKKIAEASDAVANYGKQVWNWVSRNDVPAKPNAAPVQSVQPVRIDANERGWYAINTINTDGHNLLGQFVEGPDKQIKRIQTDRVGKFATDILSSGFRELETKVKRGEELNTTDYLWAGVDVLPLIGVAKGLRLAKQAATAGKEVRLSTKTRLLAPKLFESSAMRRLAKYGSGVAVAYLVVQHPALINSLFGQMAKVFGVDPWLFQLAGWWLILSVLLFPFIGVLKVVAKLLLAVFSLLEKSRPKTGSPSAIPAAPAVPR